MLPRLAALAVVLAVALPSCGGDGDVGGSDGGDKTVEQSGDTTSVVVHLSPAAEDKRVVSLRDEGGSLKIDAIERSG
jgi:hypothetical protein